MQLKQSQNTGNNWYYDYNDEQSIRYTLGEPGNKVLVCIGANPSTATIDNLDRTVASVRNRAHRNGYDGWLMLNVFPVRETNPNKLLENYETAYLSDIISSNAIKSAEAIEYLLKKTNTCDIWVAWGDLLNKRIYLKESLKILYKQLTPYTNGCNFVALKISEKTGNPHHPLYVNNDESFSNFNLEEYMRKLK